MYDDSTIVNYVLVYHWPEKVPKHEARQEWAGKLTFPGHKRGPSFRPMTESLPGLPMNEGRYHLHNNEKLKMSIVTFSNLLKSDRNNHTH